MLVGRRVQEQARVLRAPGGQHHRIRGLNLLLVVAVVIFDPGDLLAEASVRTRVTVRRGPHLGAGVAGLAEIGTCGLASAPIGQPTWHQPS